MKSLIIIPTYNEVENLSPLLQEIFLYAPLTDVLIVDDHSPDGTGELADELQKKDMRVHVLHRSGKLGLGTAYLAGFKFALVHGYDAAFEMDADFSHDPRYLPAFLRAIEHADVVIGSRYIVGGDTPNWSVLRRLISGSGNIFARLMLGIAVHDCTSGFRCYRRRVLESIDLDVVQSHGYAFQVELTYRVMMQGFQMVETPIVFIDRRCGKSKMSRAIILEALTYVLQTRLSQQAAPMPLIRNILVVLRYVGPGISISSLPLARERGTAWLTRLSRYALPQVPHLLFVLMHLLCERFSPSFMIGNLTLS